MHHPADDDDAPLVTRAAAGDDAAFDALMHRYAPRVYGICHRYFRDPRDAEDAAQAAMVACYRGLPRFQGSAKFSTWLFRVTTNACHDLARRAARRPTTVPLDETRDAGPDHADAAALERIAAAELRPDLVAALGQLDPEQRHAVVLRDVVGASYVEIAAAQDVAVGTAKSRVHRAHARLADLLTDLGNPVRSDERPTVQDRPPT